MRLKPNGEFDDYPIEFISMMLNVFGEIEIWNSKWDKYDKTGLGERPPCFDAFFQEMIDKHCKPYKNEQPNH